MQEWIDVPTADGRFKAYIARPSVAPAPCVVVLQELFGVNADVRQTCNELARDGYFALAPDLFWRSKPGLDLSDQTDEEWKLGMACYQAFDLEKGISDVAAVIARSQALPGASGKVGVMGFCMGGLLTFIVAARYRIDAAAVYYGGDTECHLSEATTLSSPLMMHIGEEDEYISKDAQRRIKAALQDIDGVQVFTYAGSQHAFARHRGAHFDANAAMTANARTSEFLARHLR